MRMVNVCRMARYLLRTRPIFSLSQRCIFSKTGVWPPMDQELTIDVKRDAESYWKNVYTSRNQVQDSERSRMGQRKGKKYVLAMFPYPSGKLHMGHVRVYTISDAMARFYQLQGYEVLHPMGWDAFGLPAENAAIERNEMPDKWTYSNIPQMKEQLLDLGCKFNWERELATCDPEYYRWTQYIFLLLFREGLAYQEEAQVNWDPIDQTVLADEQVDSNGCSWRSGAKVERRFLKQWFIKTTRFAKSLLDGLSDPVLEDWRDIIKVQKHWIGDCNGYRIEMEVVHSDGNNDGGEAVAGGSSSATKLDLWMPEPELLHGVSFVGLRPGHKLDTETNIKEEINKIRVLNVRAVCPISNRKIPVIVSSRLPFAGDAECYVGMPFKSEKDQSIARTCGFEIVNVKENDLMVNSGLLDDHSPTEARQLITDELLRLGAGGFETSAKLRDWLISRQRYWGTPIPIIHCPSCGVVPVPEEQLPVVLPKITKFPKKGISPLKEATEWIHCSCPKCGGPAERETDTMDTFVDSSWYFLRFLDPHNTEKPFSHDAQSDNMPVDLYVGGKEHAVLHMFYARFIQHFLASLGLASHKEPFKRLVTQGMVMGETYRVKDSGRYLTKDEVDFSVKPPVERGTGSELVVTYEKMSKSKHNGIDPKDVLEEYGTDTTRLLMLANFAPSSQRNWSKDTFPGILNWQNRLWLTVSEFIHMRQDKELQADAPLSMEEIQEHKDFLFENRNFYLRGATYNFLYTNQLSVAISYMQGLTVSLRKIPKEMMLTEEFEKSLAAQIIMLSPITPHLASELWAGFCSVATSPCTRKDVPLLEQQWPEIDSEFGLPLFCRIPGKDPCIVKVPRSILDSMTVDTATAHALANEEVQNCMVGKQLIRTHLQIQPGIGGNLSFVAKALDPASSKEERKRLKEEKKRLKKERKNKKSNMQGL